MVAVSSNVATKTLPIHLPRISMNEVIFTSVKVHEKGCTNDKRGGGLRSAEALPKGIAASDTEREILSEADIDCGHRCDPPPARVRQADTVALI
jgi:hypothetical protein